MRVVVLCGGYGGAKMAHGFALLGSDIELSVVANTADDLRLHGLHISPDLDTLMYTLAGLANAESGWGVRDETWSASEMLASYGAATWFRLGDRDLATHIHRTDLLASGLTLTEVTQALSRALDVRADLLPMSNDRVSTKVRTSDGWLDFQDYFVRRRHRDTVLELRFDGVESAEPSEEAVAAISEAELIVVAPSNPFVSIGPMLALTPLREAVVAADAPVIGVSPIVGGAALRGPAAEMLRTLGSEPSAAGLAALYARRYPRLLDILLIDEADRHEADAVAECGIEPLVRSIVMRGGDDRRRLAEEIVAIALQRR